MAGNPNGLNSLTYEDFTLVRSSVTSILNLTASTNMLSQLTMSGLITVDNNTYTVSTPTPISFGAYYLSAGMMRITDASGNRIDLLPNTLGGGTVDIHLYVGSAITPTRTTNAVWTAL
ncbi:MAG: hypothetical protein ACKO1L_01840 [Brachymonas sp.]